MENVILDASVIDISGIKDPSVSEVEKEAVLDVFKKSLNIEPTEVSKINSKFTYDYYKVVNGNDTYAIKMSYMSNDVGLQTEAENLDRVNAKYPNLISPNKVAFGTDNELTYLIISYEGAESIETFSIDELLSYNVSFVTMMDAMHEINIDDFPRLNHKLAFDRSILDMQSEIPEEVSNFMFETHNIIEADIFKVIKKVSEYIVEHYDQDNLVFSNFNISKSTLLLRDGIIKCTNFESCYALNVFLSLKIAFTNLSLFNKLKTEERLVKSYALNSTVFNMDEETFFLEYKKRQKINKLIIFSDLFSKQVFQIYAEGIDNQTRLYKNFEKYNHVRSDVKEVIGEISIKIVDKFFNKFLMNHIE